MCLAYTDIFIMSDHSRLQELFNRYRQRLCTAAEVEELMVLLQDTDAEAKLSGAMQELWQQLQGTSADHPVDWEKMYDRVSHSEEDLYTLRHQHTRSLRRLFYPVAAIMFLALLIPAAWWLMSRRRAPMKMPVEVAAAPAPPKEKRRVLRLPDGSAVTLNRNSRLEYAAAFAGASREVYLSGEAFFDIVRVPGKPFLVHTGKVTTRVLGTSFNIRAYPSDKAIEITVAHGKVLVTEEKVNRGLLTDAQQLRLEPGKDQYAFKKVDVAAVIAWRPQEIHFDDIMLGDAARQIEQRFGRTVRFVNPLLKNCRLTATFYEDDGLDEIMTVICAISQSTWSDREKEIIIDGKGCN
jgi:transmembrane sensor